MATKSTSRVKDRLRGVVTENKISEIENMLRLLKSDQYRLLTNYMYLNRDDLKVYIDVTDEGEYILTVRAVTDKLIDVGKVL